MRVSESAYVSGRLPYTDGKAETLRAAHTGVEIQESGSKNRFMIQLCCRVQVYLDQNSSDWQTEFDFVIDSIKYSHDLEIIVWIMSQTNWQVAMLC
jgi:hypothetical protein